MMRALRARLVWALAATAATTVGFWAITLAPGDGQSLTNSDVFSYFYPVYETTYARVAAGELPLWNPYQLCGVPWIATLQGGFFYPPHLLYVLLPTPTALAVLAAGHLALAAVAMACFVRRVGIGLPGAFLAGVLLAIRGSTPGLIVFPNFLEAAAWLPVGAIGVVDIARGRRLVGAAVLGAAVGMSLLAGYPQATVYCLYAWATLLAVLVIRTPRTWMPAGGASAVAVAAGVLLAAAQLLPTEELSASGLRQARALSVEQMYPLGMLASRQVWTDLRNASLGGGVGAFGVTGAALLVLAPLSSVRAIAWWALVFGAGALLFVLGEPTAFFRAVVQLPALAWFRVPQRALFLVDFCFALAAAAGLDAIARAADPGVLRRRLVLLLVVTVSLGVVASRQGHQAAVATAVVIAAGAVAVFAFPARRTAGVLALVGAAVFQAAGATPPDLAMPYDRERAAVFDSERDTYAGIEAAVGHDRFWLFSGGTPPYEFMRKQASRYRVRTIDDYEPLTTRRQAEYLTYLQLGRVGPPRGSDIFLGSWWIPHATGGTVPVRRRLLDLAAVRLVVVPVGIPGTQAVHDFLVESGFTRREVRTDAVVYENPAAVARAYVVHRTTPAPPVAELLRRLAEPSYDPLVSTYVEGPEPFAPDPAAPTRGAPATFVRDDDVVVEVETTAAAIGLLVLADTFYSGWTATVDGVPAPIVPANHLFRGVVVPAGTHRVRFEYAPSRITAGAVASAFAAVLLIGLVVVDRRHGASLGEPKPRV